MAADFEWKTDAPERQGIDPTRLAAATAALKDRNTWGLLIIRNDRIVYEWYAPGAAADRTHGTASLAKALSGDGRTVHLVFSGEDSFSVRRATLRLHR